MFVARIGEIGSANTNFMMTSLAMTRRAPAPHRSERATLRRAAGGDHAALSELLDSHRKALARHLMALTQDAAIVDDLVQDTFERALVGVAGFRGDSSLATWLHGIAIHVARNHRAKHRRRRRLGERFEQAADRPPPSCPESDVRAQQAYAQFLAALDELPDELREAFELRVLDGLTVEAAAELLAIPPSTLSHRARRAEACVRERMQGASS